MLQLTAGDSNRGSLPPRRRRALRGTPRRAQRNGCLQNSNDSFQPQKQVLQSSTERFVFSEWWIRPCKIVLMCCYSDQKDFQNKSSVVLHYKLSFFWDEKSFSMNLQVTAYTKKREKEEKKNLDKCLGLWSMVARYDSISLLEKYLPR